MQYASSRVGVSVPATSANLGPGFDSMGLGRSVRDEMTFEALASGGTSIEIEGEGAQTLPRDERHLVVQALRRTQEYLWLPLTGFAFTAHNRIPQSRGMGSSASAIVAGVSAAVAFSGRTDLGKDFIFNVAAQMEGHPDNVAPAVFGGLTVSWDFDPATDIPAPITGDRGPGLSVFDGYERGFHTCRYQVDGSIHPYLFIPRRPSRLRRPARSCQRRSLTPTRFEHSARGPLASRSDHGRLTRLTPSCSARRKTRCTRTTARTSCLTRGSS